MKKRILIVAGSLRIGGIERSLVNLLNCLDYSKYDVDLFLYSNIGEYINEIPKNVNLINKSRLLNCIGLTKSEALETKNITVILIRFIAAMLCRIMGSRRFYKTIFSWISPIGPYDIAISYSNNVGTKTLYSGYNQFVLEKVIAHKKVAWIHSDYIKAGLNIKLNNDEYRKFDVVINVSYAGKRTFDKVVPEMKERSFVVYNMYPIERIKRMADNSANPYNNSSKIKIVTVARMDLNKSIDRVLNVAARLRDDGYDFEWYIVGDGDQRTKLEALSKRLNLNDKIHFLGSQRNPYPFIKNADLFVLTSKYEGMPMVITESLILGTPVVTTRYAAADEQIKDNFNGFITENSEDGLFQTLKSILSDNSLLEKLKYNISVSKFSNDVAIKQFDCIIDL